MESFNSFETQESEMEYDVSDFVHELSKKLDEYLPIEYIGGTYEIEADSFSLSFVVDEDMFEIRNIDVRGNSGTGSEVISTISEYAEKHDLELVASNVRDVARGFWEKMGFEEGSTPDEFYKVG